MPALPSSILEPPWVQVAALLPTRQVHHPLGCHRPRIPDRIVFDKLIQVLVFGCGYRRIADHTCSATSSTPSGPTLPGFPSSKARRGPSADLREQEAARTICPDEPFLFAQVRRM